jgi:hypothetical protein
VIGPDIFAFAALWRRYRQCRRNKRNTINALAFEVNAEANLLALQEELRAHTYKPGRSICFITDGPKPREVFAADFRDRVVHHLLVSHQERVFEPIFIHDSYACRKGKGTLAASDRLMRYLRQETANGRRPAWAVKLDVANFFPSIHKATLHEILARKIAHPELRWLTRTLLFHDPTTNYRFRSRDPRAHGPESRRYAVPPHKSLFGKQNLRGLAIGNLTSQFWANVYLNELDQFVKRALKCRHYLRYVDDMVLLAPEREPLVRWCAAIEAFLAQRLKLALRPEMGVPFSVRKGIDFIGWKTWWNRRLPRRRTLGNLRARLAGFERAAVRPGGGRRGAAHRPRPPGRGRQRRSAAVGLGVVLRAPASRCGVAGLGRGLGAVPLAGGAFRAPGLGPRRALVAAAPGPRAPFPSPVLASGAPRRRRRPGLLPSGPVHRVLWPPARRRCTGFGASRSGAAAGLLRVNGGFPDASVRPVPIARAPTGPHGDRSAPDARGPGARLQAPSGVCCVDPRGAQ